MNLDQAAVQSLLNEAANIIKCFRHIPAHSVNNLTDVLDARVRLKQAWEHVAGTKFDAAVHAAGGSTYPLRVSVTVQGGCVVDACANVPGAEVAVLDMDNLATVGVYTEKDAKETIAFPDGTHANSCSHQSLLC